MMTARRNQKALASLAKASPFHWYMADSAEWTEGEDDPQLLSRLSFAYMPLREEPDLFHKFVELPGDKESFARFALEYGPLCNLDLAKEQQPQRDRLSDWKREHKQMSEAVSLFQAFNDGEVSKHKRGEAQERLGNAIYAGLWTHAVRPQMISNGSPLGAGLELTFRAINLAGAMWLQLALAIDGNRQYAVCEFCGKRFETAKPDEARICGEKCKNARNYLKRKGQWKGGETQ